MSARTPSFLTSPLAWVAFATGAAGFAADIARSRPRTAVVPVRTPPEPLPRATKASKAPPAMDELSEKKSPGVAGEELTATAADRVYREYVEGWKREEGPLEEAVRQVVGTQRGGGGAATQAAEGDRPRGSVDTETVPLSELTDFMMDRSRK